MNRKFPRLSSNEYFCFPPAREAGEEGVLGYGGNLSPGMLISAYRQGVFPWYSQEQPILWWTPDPRFILRPSMFHMSRSLRKFLRKSPYTLSLDRAFPEVVAACATVERPGQDGTWITPEMFNGYRELHEAGYAHSVEVWKHTDLVGGLYGVAVGSLFAGESMFSFAPNASKYALAVLSYELGRRGSPCIDCQVETDHMIVLGGEHVTRHEYLSILKAALLSSALDDLWEHPSLFGDSFSV